MSSMHNEKYTISFQNPGLIDPLAITTFGVHVKETNNPIGHFGTGLKYAIAVLLRHECEVDIYVGNTKYAFSSHEHNIRGKSFDIVTMNGEPTGFTTELGKEWELWMAFRELYCNALDEDGSLKEGTYDPLPDHTTVILRGAVLEDCYREKSTIVLEDTPLVRGRYVDILPGKSEYIFYRGVRIYTPNKPTMYTYNIRDRIELTEDRTAKYSGFLEMYFARTIFSLAEEHEDFIKRVILADSHYWESTVSYDNISSPSEAALKVAEQHRLNPDLNPTIHTLLTAHNRKLPMEPLELNEIQEKQLRRAIDFLRKLGYSVDTRRIVTTGQLKGGLLGLAENNTIYIAPKVYDMGTKYVASTLLEEYLHLETGYDDMTRELQNHLFDMLMSFGERIIGEPL